MDIRFDIIDNDDIVNFFIIFVFFGVDWIYMV